MNIKYYTFLSKFLCLRLSRPSRSPGMENVIHLGTVNTPQLLLTETLLRSLVRGQDEVVVEAELGAAVQPSTRTVVIIVCL